MLCDLIPDDARGAPPPPHAALRRSDATIKGNPKPGCSSVKRGVGEVTRFRGVIGDALRPCTDERRAAEVEVAVHVLNRMLDLGRPNSVRIASPSAGLGTARPSHRSMQQRHAVLRSSGFPFVRLIPCPVWLGQSSPADRVSEQERFA